MPRFKKREYLSEFKGMRDVIKATSANGTVAFYTKGWRFSDEANRIGACKLNIADNEFGFFLHLFNSNNETVGVYKMHSGLRGFTAAQLAGQKNRLYFCKILNLDKDLWETYVYGNLVQATIYKYGCGLATILKDDKWSVIDRNNNYVIPPGKYDYIDGFDKCGLARVKIDGKADIFEPRKSTYDRWGLIDTKGEEILPLKYSEIWSFYNKNRMYTRVFCDGFDEDDIYVKRMEEYHFLLPNKDYPMGKLKGPGEWFGNQFQTYEEIDLSNIYSNYSIWDALDGEIEAAGNLDFFS